MADCLPRGQTKVKGCLLSVNISESLWLLILEDDQTLPQSFHQQTAMDVNVEDLTVLVLTVSPAKEFTSQGTACYLSRMTVKKVVGWERNGEKCPAGRFHSYL